MRIVIDMQACQNGSRFRGIGRYTLGIVSALLELSKDKHEYHLLFNGMFEDNLAELIAHFSKLVSSKNIHIWHGIGPTEGCNPQNKYRRDASAILRHYFLEKLQPDAVFLPTYFEGFGDHTVHSIPEKRNYKVYATCHDLIPLVQRDIYLDPHPIFKPYYLNQVQEYKKADGYLAVSESSKQELITYTNIPQHKVINTLEGIESQFKNSHPNQSDIEKILNLKINHRKLILYFGASDERKNHLKLIKAFSLLSQSVRNESILVLAGIGVKEHYEKFKEYAFQCGLSNKEFVIVGRVTDEEVIDLYSYCYLFVFPSFHEGFGLPALEAMACGTAVITANTTSLPEVVGKKELTFDPYSSISIKNALEKFILNADYRNKVAEYCLNRSKEFSWNQSAKIALNFIESNHKNQIKEQSSDNCKLREQAIKEIKKRKISSHLTQSEKEKIAVCLIQNFRDPRKPRLLYDISKLITLDFITGVQRVTIEILTQLQKLYASKFEVIPVKISEDGDLIEEVCHHYLSRGKHQHLSSSELMDLRPGDLYLNIDLDHSVPAKHKAYQKMRLKGCKTHFIVHDLLPIELGDSFFSEHSALHHYMWLKEVAQADALICVSRSVMNSVNYYLNAIPDVNPELQLGWFHLGTHLNHSNQVDKSLKTIKRFNKINFEKPVFLMVGSVEPRKGHLEVIDTFTELWDQGFQGSLVIVGNQGWNNELILEITKSSQYKDKFLFWPQKVNDQDLNFLYQHSTCLIAASFGEGFGLPLIEALEYDLSVIARDIPVFREVTNDQALFFSNTNELKALLKNAKKGHKLGKIEYQNWEESTQQLMKLIIDNEYDIEWEKDKNTLLLPICSDKFGTSCGKNTKDRIKTSYQDGLLVWGGYFPISQGTYNLKIYGKSSQVQSIHIELISIIDGQPQILFKRQSVQVAASSNQYDIAELIVETDISVPTNIGEAEIYIKVSEENNLSISRFEISKESALPYYMFDTTQDNFISTVGLKNEKGIYTQNHEGLLLKGGNLNLKPGKYTLEIFGTAPTTQNIGLSIGYFDEFNIQKNHIEFKSLKIDKTENSILSRKSFTLKQAIKDAEFFVNVDESNMLKISELKLVNY